MFNRLQQKISRDVERYLKNQEPQNPQQPSSQPRRDVPPTDPRREVARTPERPEPLQFTSTTSVNLQREPSKSNKGAVYETESILINNNKISALQVQLRITSKKRELVIELFQSSEPKFKFEYKSELTAIDIVGGTQLVLRSSKIQEYKNMSKERKLQWMLVNTYILPNKENVVSLTFPAAELVKGTPVKSTLFDKLSDEEFMIMRDGEYIQGQSKQDQKQDTQENDEKVEFRPLVKEDFLIFQRVRKSLLSIKEEDKAGILTDIFKIKKEYDNPLVEKRLKCPILSCMKSFQQGSQLKNHFKKSHPEQSKNGIEVNDYGVFEYSSKAVDFALIMAKIFPIQVKKLIKKMKTKEAEDERVFQV